MVQHGPRLVDYEAPLPRRVDEDAELGLDRGGDHAHLLQVSLERRVVLLHHDLRRRGVERDHVAVQLAQDLRQHHGRGAVVEVDHHLERRAAHRLQVDLGQHVLHVAVGLLVASRDASHLVVRHAADVLAEEEPLELALAALVDVEAEVVEDSDVA